jgi:16S rRNA (uracil1498-N3)-methyltransferase
MPLFYQPQIQQGVSFLDVEESRHAIQVLRLRDGDPIEIVDGQGVFYAATITKADAKKCIFEVTEKKVTERRTCHVHIAIAPTKNIDRTEWFVEKAVEIGIEKITFIQCKHSERKVINRERIQKVAISAMKQSGQAWLPSIEGIVDFDTVLTGKEKEKFIAHVDSNNSLHLKDAHTKNSEYIVLIGPEGDFSQHELEQAQHYGFKKVSLGVNRLRTETAALAACHILDLQ